jgi:hypothetical protein
MLWLIHIVKTWAGDYCWFKTLIMYIFISSVITIVIILSLDYSPSDFPYFTGWQKSLKLCISTFEVVIAVLQKSPFSRMWPHVIWYVYTFTDPTEERTVSVFNTEGKGSSSRSYKSSVKFCWIKRLHFPEYCTFTTPFVCISETFLFSVTHCPVSSDARVSGFWLTDQHLISDIKRTFLFLTVFK